MLLVKLALDQLVNGSVVDTSGNNRTTVCTDVQIIPDPEGKFGACAAFNGTTSKISIAGLTCRSTFTFAAWVRKSATLTAGYATLVEFGNDAPYFGFIGGKPILYRGAAATQDFGLSWNHIVVTQDGSGSRLYVNGTLVTTGLAVRTDGTGVGIGYNWGDNYFKGELRDVLIYDEAVSVRTNQNTIWLDSSDGSSTAVSAQRHVPVAVAVRSSQSGDTPAQLLMSLTDRSTASPWQSASNSGVDEWIEYDLGATCKLMLTQIEAHFATGSAGVPRIQGSNDRVRWKDLYTMTLSQPFEVATGFMGVKETIARPRNAGYRFIRLISSPGAQLSYSFLELTGVNVACLPVAVSVRSDALRYTPAQLLINLTDPYTRNYWHSAVNSGVDEWVEYDYGANQKIVPTHMTAHFVNGRWGGRLKIQGSNDRTNWTDLSSPGLDSAYVVQEYYRGLEIAIPAPATVGYRYVRLISSPAPYLCYTFLELTSELEQSPSVAAAAVSSNANGYTPAQVLQSLTNSSSSDWWTSAINSGVDEWIEYDYGVAYKLAPTRVVAHFENGRSGDAITIQGSNDRTNWTTLHTTSFADQVTIASGCREAKESISTPTKAGYRYIRLTAKPNAYLCYSFLEFSGELV